MKHLDEVLMEEGHDVAQQVALYMLTCYSSSDNSFLLKLVLEGVEEENDAGHKVRAFIHSAS